MPYVHKTYIVTTESVDFVSLVHDIASAIKDAGAVNGLVCVVVPKEGAGLFILRNSTDMKEKVEPHLPAEVLPRSIVVPVVEGALILAPYEEVFLVDCEKKMQRREVVITVTSEVEAK